MTGDGSDTTLTLSVAPISENQTFVTIDGVVTNQLLSFWYNFNI